LVGEASGEIELEENVLVIRRIHVRMRLKSGDGNLETATRGMGSSWKDAPFTEV
jgi:hypothetical protein